MQHGQKITAAPKNLLKAAGFTVKDPAEGHLCCGSAGTYNIMQPEISAQLKARKVRNIEATKPDVIATGNIGCITQIASGTGHSDHPHGRIARLGLWRKRVPSRSMPRSV
jgi:glycolate oxidase iron-sulfur subunit